VTRFADLADLPEDERISAIGRAAARGQVVGVALEKDEPEKIARYIKKITTLYPGVKELDRADFTPGVVLLRFGLAH
jgi:hypothetical protein